jgi:hypothetical protein
MTDPKSSHTFDRKIRSAKLLSIDSFLNRRRPSEALVLVVVLVIVNPEVEDEDDPVAASTRYSACLYSVAQIFNLPYPTLNDFAI